MANHKEIIPFILSWEGGYVNDPDDSGGATNKGITIATWRLHGYDNDGDGDVDVQDLKKITMNQWEEIFKTKYWDKVKGDDINDQSVANMIVDWFWNSGYKAVKKIQSVIGVKPDGIIGRKTLAAINEAEPTKLFELIKESRKDFFHNIVRRNPSQKKFLNGWLNRLNSIGYGSLKINR